MKARVFILFIFIISSFTFGLSACVPKGDLEVVVISPDEILLKFKTRPSEIPCIRSAKIFTSKAVFWSVTKVASHAPNHCFSKIRYPDIPRGYVAEVVRRQLKPGRYEASVFGDTSYASTSFTIVSR